MNTEHEKEDRALGELFGAARRDLPAVDADRITRAVVATPVASPSPWRSLLPKFGLVAAVMGLGLGGVALFQGATPSHVAPPAVPPLVVAAHAEAEAPAVVVPEVAHVESAAEDETPPPPPRRRAVSPVRAASPELPPPPEASAPSESEVALQEGAVLLRARRALSRGDAASALAACDEHARDFHAGRLSPEREAIAIDALNALGQRAQARARAERFIAQWPDSAYADRARRALSE